MASTSPTLPERPSLAQLYEAVNRADDPERALLALTLEGAARRHPELPAAVRLAAIPRRFEAVTLARLRGEAEPSAETDGLLEQLAALPLVRKRPGGTFSVTDGARDLLLQQWRERPESRAEFERLNEALFELHRARFEEVLEDERTLGLVSALLRRVSAPRYAALVAHIEGRQIAPLLEALYHETLRSARAGFDFFSRSFQRYEAAGRPAACESLLSAMRDTLERLPEDDELPPLRHWLDYYEARLAARVGDHRKARVILERLRGAGVADARLQLWVLSELGGLYQGTNHYRAARHILREELEIALATRVDPYNIPTSQLRLAGLHRGLNHLESAGRLLREAIRTARAEGRDDLELSSRIELARVLLDRGDLDGARAEAVRALDHARREPVRMRDQQDAVADLFMTLQANDEPALVDTLFQERLGLVEAIVESSADARLYLDLTGHLRAGGQLERALAVLAGPARVPAGTDPAADVTYQLRLALALEESGRLEAAADAYRALIELARRRPAERFNVAAAYSNRGLILRDLGRHQAAQADFEIARKRWIRMGMARLAAFMDAMIADTRLADARRRQLAPPPAARPAHAAELAAEAALEASEWAAAEQHCRRGLALADAEAMAASRARLHGRLAAAAGACGQWHTATEQATAAAAAWRAAGRDAAADQPPAPVLAPESLADVLELIEAAERHLDHEAPGFRGDLLHTRARYFALTGDEQRCYATLQLAARQPEATADRNSLAGIHLDAARSAGALGRADDAAGHAEEAARIWHRLARNAALRPTEAAARANDENDRGLRALTADVATRGNVVRAARDLFLAASRRLPDHWWYALNLSYASAAAEDWGEAADALQAALRHGPEWLQGTVLYLRLATYRIEEAGALARTGGADAAARALTDAATMLESYRPSNPDLLRELPRWWQQLGDGFGIINYLAEAAACYQRALTMSDEGGAAAESRANLHARVAMIEAQQGHTAAAAARFRVGAELLAGNGGEPAYETLSRQVRPLIGSAADYDCFAEVLRSLSRNPDIDAAARRQIIRARLELNRESFRQTHHPAATPEAGPTVQPALPVVTPTAINAHPDLFPAGEGWAESHPLFTGYIPAMRARIREDLGVEVPGIRVRADEDLQPRTYLIQLDEVPVALGTVEPGGSFCREQAAAGRPLSGTPALDPSTGAATGLWLDEAGLAAATAAGIATWDHYEYMVRHLEQLQRERITLYVGLQELETLLADWQAGQPAAGAGQLIAEALPDLTARLRYLQVLHGLLREGIGVSDQESILRVFAAHAGGAELVRTCIEAARQALAERLPGNHRALAVLWCDAAFEARVAAGVAERGRARVLALTPETTGELVGEIRAALEEVDQRRTVIVTRTPGLRPMVRSLVEVEFPYAHVMDERELAPSLRSRADGHIGAGEPGP